MVDRIKVNLTGLGGTLASTEELQIVYPGSCAGDCAFRDGEVNVTDLLALLGAWERIRKRAGSSVCPEQVPRGSSWRAGSRDACRLHRPHHDFASGILHNMSCPRITGMMCGQSSGH